MDNSSVTFADLGLSGPLVKSVAHSGFPAPYPIQQLAIPFLLKGKDVLGIAPTGSGKTAAYALPILQQLLTQDWRLPNRHIPVLVLVPTRELAVQVHQVFTTLTEQLPTRIKTLAVYGGASINPQMIAMQGVQVLIATPGRLLDLLDSKAMQLSELKILVLDEADKMLNAGFQAEMDRLIALMPRRRQNVLFSATLSKEVDHITQLLLHKPEVVRVATQAEEPEHLIQQRAFRVTEERKGPFLRYLIKSMELQQVLVFTSSVVSADKLVNKLGKNGIEAAASHSKQSNHARQRALEAFKAGELRVLVATDLLSRGIDIAYLPYVINYELPRSPKDYIHRIGRTGRAENPGQAFTLVTPEEQPHFKVIEKKMGRWITLESTDEVDLRGY